MSESSHIVSKLRKLASKIDVADKARAQSKPDLDKKIDEALKAAEEINWQGLIVDLRNEYESYRTRHDEHLKARREKLLQAARTNNVTTESGAHSDRIDIFRVEFDGLFAVITLGGVTVERVKEPDGQRLFDRLQQLRGRLDKGPFHRKDFFSSVRAAYTACRHGNARTDEFVAIRELHREIVLARARQSDAFRRNPEPKNVPAYPLHQFIFDLARFVSDGVAVDGERLVTQTPAMRESKDSVFIPNLNNPVGNETAAARLAVKPSS